MLSGVVKFDPKVPKQTKNEVVVKLMDSFHNPVLRQQSRLKLEITSRNNPGFLNWAFVDNLDGSYSGHYLAVEVGTYELCVSLDGNRFGSCPLVANVYSSKKRTDGRHTSFYVEDRFYSEADYSPVLLQVNISRKLTMMQYQFGRTSRSPLML